MKKMAQLRAVIMTLDGGQINNANKMQKRFDAALCSAVQEKGFIGEAEATLNAFKESGKALLPAFAEVMGLTETSLQRQLNQQLFEAAVPHVRHDSKFYNAMMRLHQQGDIQFATITSLTSDAAKEFYRVNGLSRAQACENITPLAHGYSAALSSLGYKDGDDLSSILLVSCDREELKTAKSQAMQTALIGEGNAPLFSDDIVDYEYQTSSMLLNEIYRAKREEKGPQKRPLWSSCIDNIYGSPSF